MAIISYDNKNFLMDGKPYTILSGAMHYFRIPREYWLDRLTKLKECGFNTLETYTCWNLHERVEGQFSFTGMLDIAAYIKMAGELGLNVIVRPGPYICSEWEFGGLPAWLLKYDKMPIRCNDPVYLSKVRRYYEALFDQIGPLLSTKGGPIQMVQIENEYGSYGNDHDYMQAVADIYRDLGVDCCLFTSDGACDWMLNGGTLPQYLSVANFGSNPRGNFKVLKQYRPDEPCMCGEYWCGWFDHWYEEHHVREVDDMVNPFKEMLADGASCNYYMFHGGTNFGWMNGANHTDVYQPTITSYDYNAILSEAGDRTPAYYAVRDAIRDFTGVETVLTASESAKAGYGEVKFDKSAAVLDAASLLGKAVKVPAPVYQEELDQNFGFTLYSTVVKGPISGTRLTFDVLHDRAAVYFDGKLMGIFERDRRNPEIVLNLQVGEAIKVDILVENMGRVNYGPRMRDRKGAVGIRFGQQYHFGWEVTPLTMPQFDEPNNLTDLPYADGAEKTFEGSLFLKGTMTVDTPADTFIRLDGFHHGCVWVNGFHLGRYYNDAGPQKTMYCPGILLKAGANEVIVLEMDGAENGTVLSVDTPDLG